MLENGRTVDRYVVEAPLGEGGMAQVYRVRHAALGTRHALKVLTLTRTDLRDRFLQEGRLQAGLRHPNVVSVTDVLEVDGQPALLLEFVDGPTLGDWLVGKRHELGEIESVFRDICAGVAAAHERGFVHRDLKPGNVLMARVGEQWSPRIADFGLAKIAGEAGPGATRTNVAMGTPAYMAPEQIRDAKRVDARADVFSLGCILYEMICRRPAFFADDLLGLLTVVSTGKYAAPETLVEGLPTRFSVAIREALQVDPDRRLPDCKSLLVTMETGSRPWDDQARTVPMGPLPIAELPPVTPAVVSYEPSVAEVPKAFGVVAALTGTTMAALGLTGSVLAVVAGAIWLSGPDAKADPEAVAATVQAPPVAPPDCVPGTPGRVGYVKVEQLRFGYTTTWKSGQRRPVYAQLDPPADVLPVCTLPADATVDLVAPAEHLDGVWWVALDGDSFSIGEPVEEARSRPATSTPARPPAATTPAEPKRPAGSPGRPGDKVDDQVQEAVEQVLDGIKAPKPKKPHLDGTP